MRLLVTFSQYWVSKPCKELCMNYQEMNEPCQQQSRQEHFYHSRNFLYTHSLPADHHSQGQWLVRFMCLSFSLLVDEPHVDPWSTSYFCSVVF